jgi:hypothetical protein
MATTKYGMFAPDGTPLEIEVDPAWDEDRIDTEAQIVLRDYMKSSTNAAKKQQMTHGYSRESEDNRDTPEYDRARRVSDEDAFLPIMGAEMTAVGKYGIPMLKSGIGTKMRANWNYLTNDPDEAESVRAQGNAEYNKLKQDYESEKALIKPLEQEHPFTAFLARSAPYVLPSNTLVRAPYTLARWAGSKLPMGIQKAGLSAIQGLKPTLPKVARDVLEGRGPLGPVVNPIKVVNAALVRNSDFAAPESAMRAAVDIMQKPGVQAATLGTAVGAAHPDDTALAGGLTGIAASGLMRTLLGPISKSPKFLTKAQQEAVKAADDLGIYLDPGARTGDPFKEQVSAVLRRDPIASPIAAQTDVTNSQHINRLIGKYFRMVDDTPELDSSTLMRINEQLGKRYDNLYSMSNPYLTSPMVGKLNRIKTEEIRNQGGVEKGPIIEQINTIFHMSGVGGKNRWGKLSTEDLQNLRTKIRQQKQMEFETKSGTPREGKQWDAILDVLDESLIKGIPNKVRDRAAQELAKIRKEYATFSVVQKSTDKNSGMLNLASLYENLVGTPGAKNTNYRFLKNEDLISKLARIGRLQKETKAKMDLGTRSSVANVLHEKRPVYNRLAKNAVFGWYGLPSSTLKRATANIYFNPSGYPAATGAIPIFSKEAGDRLNKIISRSSLGEMPFDPELFPGKSNNIWE